MSPQRDGRHEGELDESQEQVRRLLAAAGSPAPEVPSDVADRLDSVLADLVAERSAAPGESVPGGPVPADEVTGVTELASRRRRWGPRLLVAAAGVSVLALGVGVGLDGLTGAGEEQAVTSESAGAGSAAQPERDATALDRTASSQGPADVGTAPDQLLDRTRSELGLPTPVPVRSSALRADLQRIEDSATAMAVADSRRRWAAACVRPRVAPGDEWLPVRLDGEAAVLLLRAPADGRRTGDVFTCDDAAAPAASAVVDTR